MSLIKAIRQQLGLSVTPANNFCLDASAADGTMKLARGNAGATTQDVLKVTSGGVIQTPQNVVAFRANTVSASIPTGTGSPTILIPASKVFDTANAYNTSTGKFQPTVAGYYLLVGAAYYSSSGIIASYVGSSLMRNGAEIFTAAQGTSSSVIYPVIEVTGIVYLNGSTDYVQLGTKHNASGTATNVGADFSGHLLSAT